MLIIDYKLWINISTIVFRTRKLVQGEQRIHQHYINPCFIVRFLSAKRNGKMIIQGKIKRNWVFFSGDKLTQRCDINQKV